MFVPLRKRRIIQLSEQMVYLDRVFGRFSTNECEGLRTVKRPSTSPKLPWQEPLFFGD